MKNPMKDAQRRPGNLAPPTRSVSQQVPFGDDSDISQGRDPEEKKDVDRQVTPIPKEDQADDLSSYAD